MSGGECSTPEAAARALHVEGSASTAAEEAAVDFAALRGAVEAVLARENVAVDAALAVLVGRAADGAIHVAPANLLLHPRLAVFAPHARAEDLLALELDPEVARLGEDGLFYPVLKSPRRTLIFRGLAPADEPALRELLAPEDILALKFETTAHAGPAAYVTLATEAQASAAALRLLGQELRGQPLKVGIKNEPAYTVPSAPRPHARPPRRYNPARGPGARRGPFPRDARRTGGPPKKNLNNLTLDHFPPLGEQPAAREFIRYTPDVMKAIRDGISA